MARILNVTGYISSKYGSLERHFVSLAKECTSRGHRPYWIVEAMPHPKAFVDDLEAAGGNLSVMPARHRNVAFILRMAIWLTRNRINVVHTHFDPASLLTLLAARCVRIPVRLFTVHGCLSEDRIRGLPRRTRLVSRMRGALATKAFAVSEHAMCQYQLLGMPSERIVKAYVGIETGRPLRNRGDARRELGFSDADLVIACIAFHDPVKGIDVLLRAVSLLASDFDRIRVLQIGGPGDPRETARLESLADTLGIADRVVWTGYRNDARELLGAADLYCQPSRSEALGLAVLEAMDAGLAVVGARVGGIPEVVQHGQTGILFAPESPEDLAEALRFMLRDEGRRRIMGANGQQSIRGRFDVTTRTRVMVDWYEHLCTQ